jgi:hypothetical protein
LQEARQNDDEGRRHANGRVSRREGKHGDCDRHQGDDKKHRGLSAASVGIDSQHDAPDGAHEKTDTECRARQQQRRILTVGRKK